jgi:hypothetical protein
VEKVAEISCVTKIRIRKILTIFSSDFLDWGLLEEKRPGEKLDNVMRIT